MHHGKIPISGVNNFWFKYRSNDACLVFVHGLLSDSRGCWLHCDKDQPDNNVYWPALIDQDRRFADISIYMAGYHTAVDSGRYEIRNCADELWLALKREDIHGNPPPLSNRKITFVCHSLGGIVTRYLLEVNHTHFRDKEVGLVLIASPSYGAKLANSLGNLAEFFNHSQGIQLQWGNWSLRDLDDRFRDLKEQKRIPHLSGLEIYENHFVIHKKWIPRLFKKTLVVEKESAGRYFGAAKQIPGSDHFTVCKPRHASDLINDYVLDFLKTQGLLPDQQIESPDAAESAGEPAQIPTTLAEAFALVPHQRVAFVRGGELSTGPAYARMLEVLKRGDPEILLSDILSGQWGDGELSALASNSVQAHEYIVALAKTNGGELDTWWRMFLMELCARMSDPSAAIFEVAFDCHVHWSIKVGILPALRFLDTPLGRAASSHLVSLIERSEIDVKRLAIEGLGFLGDFETIEWRKEKESVGEDGYQTEKLGPFIALAALDCAIHGGNELDSKRPLQVLESTLDELRRFRKSDIQPSKFLQRLQTLPPGRGPKLLQAAAKSKHDNFLEGLLWALDGRGSPYIVDSLYAIATGPEHQAVSNAALMALASIPGDKSLQLLDEAAQKGIAGAARARLLAIGFSRAFDQTDPVRAALDVATAQTETITQCALWAAGELAVRCPEFLANLREAMQDSRAMVRGYAMLGLAKVGQVTRKELLFAADHATESMELLLLGIAGLHAGTNALIGRGIIAILNLAPVWKLQGHLLRDLCAGLALGGGEPGELLLRLLSRGDLE